MIDFIISIIVIAGSYLLGSIPFGLLIAKKAGKGDIRKKGSGNIGATNVLRTAGKKLAAVTLALDAGKGALAVGIAKFIGGDWLIAFAGIAAVLGHIFPYWLQFKGGKGVATTIAVFAVAYWPLAIFTCASWLAVFYITRISSMSAISAIIFAMVFAFFMASNAIALMAIILGAIVIYKHKENIIRILRGQELGFGEK